MNELNFLDLVILKKIDSDSSVEKFGSIINTSFFETANLLGTVKIKGYINIESSIGGISRVALTDAGQSLLAYAEHKTNEPIEPLDNAILHALAGGAKDLAGMQNALNVRSADLAYHINKLAVQGFMDYTVKSANVSFVLTERGFNETGGVRVHHSPGGQQKEGGKAEEKAKDKPAEQIHPLTGKKIGAEPPARKEYEKPGSEDVSHILADAHAESSAPRKDPPAPQHRRPAQPSKEDEKTRRLLSKIEYYLVEYLPYILLLIIVLAIFLGALILSLTKII